MNNAQGAACTSDCLQTSADFASVLSFNQNLWTSNPDFIGTSVYKWPFPSGWSVPAATQSPPAS